MRPDFRQVERIVGRFVGVRFRHDLHEHAPLREISLFDRAEQVFLIALARFADELRGFGIREMLMALQGLEVELHPVALAGSVQERVRVRAIAVHMAHAGRAAAIGKQDRHLVQAFRRQ